MTGGGPAVSRDTEDGYMPNGTFGMDVMLAVIILLILGLCVWMLIRGPQ